MRQKNWSSKYGHYFKIKLAWNKRIRPREKTFWTESLIKMKGLLRKSYSPPFHITWREGGSCPISFSISHTSSKHCPYSGFHWRRHSPSSTQAPTYLNTSSQVPVQLSTVLKILNFYEYMAEGVSYKGMLWAVIGYLLTMVVLLGISSRGIKRRT